MVACSVLIWDSMGDILISYQMPLTRKHRGGMPKAWWWDTRHFTADHRCKLFGTSVLFHCRRNEGEAVQALPGVFLHLKDSAVTCCTATMFLLVTLCPWTSWILVGPLGAWAGELDISKFIWAWVWLKMICPQTWFKHFWALLKHMEVSWNRGTPKSSIYRWDFPLYTIQLI